MQIRTPPLSIDMCHTTRMRKKKKILFEHLVSFIFNHLGVHQHFRVRYVPHFGSK
jgi:hypothetical protein